MLWKAESLLEAFQIASIFDRCSWVICPYANCYRFVDSIHDFNEQEHPYLKGEAFYFSPDGTVYQFEVKKERKGEIAVFEQPDKNTAIGRYMKVLTFADFDLTEKEWGAVNIVTAQVKKWLDEEYKPTDLVFSTVQMFSDTERVILENVPQCYKYLFRDDNGLYLTTDPVPYENRFDYSKLPFDYQEYDFSMYEHLFECVKSGENLEFRNCL